MKNFLIISFVLVSLVANAQTTSKYAFGIMAGLDYTNVINDKSTKSKTGFLLGLNVQRTFGNALFLQSGIWYNQKGYINQHSLYNLDLTIHDLEIPLFVGAKIGKGKFSLMPNLGFSLAFNLQKNYNIISNISDGKSSSYNQKESAAAPQRVNFYLNLGLRYTLNDRLFMVLTPHYKVDLKNLVHQSFNIDATRTVGVTATLWFN